MGIEPRKYTTQTPTRFTCAEGNMDGSDNAALHPGPRRHFLLFRPEASVVVVGCGAQVPARVSPSRLPLTRRCPPQAPAVLHPFLWSKVLEKTVESPRNCTMRFNERQ